MPELPATPPPLCVDLDDTLLRTDLLWESFASCLRHAPLVALLAPFALLRGRAQLKRHLAAHARLDPRHLPLNSALLAHLRAEQAAGRRLVLATAADATFATRAVEDLALFDEIIASDGTHNLRGAAKADALVTRFGARGFDYIGDSRTDMPVWAQCRVGHVVGRSGALSAAMSRVCTAGAPFPGRASPWRGLLRLLRPHQWVKNLIVLVPLLTSHQFTEPRSLAIGLLALAAFCLCASSVYVTNDLLDISADRGHATKHRRPLAAGTVPISWALFAAPALLVAGLLLGAAITPLFTGILALHVVSALAYSWRLKQIPLLDVFLLAGFYTLRLLGGHAATGVPYSEWLLAFAWFMFVSLALVKRYQEVQALPEGSTGLMATRGYLPVDLPLLVALGAASGFLSVLVLALYVTSPQVRILYRHPALLLLISPLLMYWISRVWLVSLRGKMHDDPVVFALRDRPSYLACLLTLLLVWLAT